MDPTMMDPSLEVDHSMATQVPPDFDPAIAEQFADSNVVSMPDVLGLPDALDFLGPELLNTGDLWSLLFRFAFNMLIAWVIVQFFYYRKSRRKDYYVTFMLFSTTMFLLIMLMGNVSLQIGFTLGLFAIFGMIRYRTETVPIREMTYLFMIIGLSVINGLSSNVPFVNLLVTNALMILLTWILESSRVLGGHRSTKLVVYEKIDLVVPARRKELIVDLEKRTGLKIDKVEVGDINFLRDTANIKIYYTLGKGEVNTVDGQSRFK